MSSKAYIARQLKILDKARKAGSPLTPWQQWKFADKMASGAGMTAPKPGKRDPNPSEQLPLKF